VPATSRLGAEHQGWDVVKLALSHERIGGPRYARAALVLDRLADDVSAAVAGGRGELEAHHLAAWSACQAARVLVYQAIDLRMREAPQSRAVALARVAIVRAERAVAELVLDLYEGEGIRRSSLGNAQLKTSMIAGLGGGSVEVQLNGVATAVLDRRKR
jgi:alkylation response protein AidB-like acyl-CoA dehydrogenase